MGKIKFPGEKKMWFFFFNLKKNPNPIEKYFQSDGRQFKCFDSVYQIEMFCFRSVDPLFLSVRTSTSGKLELWCFPSLDFNCQNPL